eukprot:g77773.t1
MPFSCKNEKKPLKWHHVPQLVYTTHYGQACIASLFFWNQRNKTHSFIVFIMLGPRSSFRCSVCSGTFNDKRLFESHLEQSGHRTQRKDGGTALGMHQGKRGSYLFAEGSSVCGGVELRQRHTETRRSPASQVGALTLAASGIQGVLQLRNPNKPMLDEEAHTFRRSQVVTMTTSTTTARVMKEVPGTLQRQPVYLSFLLDTSGSMAGGKLRDAQEGIVSILEQLDQKDLVFIETFDSEMTCLTHDPVAPSRVNPEKIASLQAGGRTRLYDAITTSMPQFKKSAQRRPVLLVLTDGEDTESQSTLAEAKSALACPGVPSFHAVLLAVGQSAECALVELDPGKPHVTVHAVEDNAAGVRKAFQYFRSRLQMLIRVHAEETVELQLALAELEAKGVDLELQQRGPSVAIVAAGDEVNMEATITNEKELQPALESIWRRPVLLVLTDGEDTESQSTLAEAKSALACPGVPNFHAVLLAVGQSAECALVELDPGKPHVTVHTVEDNAAGVRKAFQYFRSRLQMLIRVHAEETVNCNLHERRGFKFQDCPLQSHLIRCRCQSKQTCSCKSLLPNPSKQNSKAALRH